ncbi:putative endonuclease lcl3 [Tulasnella sp. 419]|nr:putative endonuclease lcl3 [Tulasnella sp. 419]
MANPWPSEPDFRQISEEVRERLAPLLNLFPPYAGPAALGSVLTLATLFSYKRFWKRIPNADAVPFNVLSKKRWIKGVVTSVGDGDNFRLYHTPGLFWRWPFKFRSVPTSNQELKDRTIHIRLAGADAPEAPHFGKPGQPYAKESLQWLRRTTLGKRVYCQLVRRDQYGRIVAVAHLPPRILPSSIFTGRSISLMMITDGWATTYDQAGAEYGKIGKEEFLRRETAARTARRGMWQSSGTWESPSAYKKRMDASIPPTIDKKADVEAQPDQQPDRRGLLSRLFGYKEK